KTVAVVNPFADQLTFLSDKTRTRRDHMKYLTLIRCIALLHQHQRPIKHIEHRGKPLAYIEVLRSDIVLANRLAHDILGRTLDELPPQTRRLLELLQGWVEARSQAQGLKDNEFRFGRKDVREATGWGDTQLKIHLGRLTELEYLLLHRKGLAHEYTLTYDGKSGNQPHLMGLIDADLLDNKSARSEEAEQRSDSGRPMVGTQSDTLNHTPSHAASGLEAEAVGLSQKPLIQQPQKNHSALSSAV
ncbi:MAG: DNA primase, partial [Burkholderiales bacterium]